MRGIFRYSRLDGLVLSLTDRISARRRRLALRRRSSQALASSESAAKTVDGEYRPSGKYAGSPAQSATSPEASNLSEPAM
jgi:hypothetical protein